jgi:hypothetical protein
MAWGQQVFPIETYFYQNDSQQSQFKIGLESRKDVSIKRDLNEYYKRAWLGKLTCTVDWLEDIIEISS